MRVPWRAGRSNQSILKDINPEYSLEGFAEAEVPNTLATRCKEKIRKDLDAQKD